MSSEPSGSGNATLPHPAASDGEGERQNLAMVLAYDGGLFQGWQFQPHGPTVQGRLEEALRTITGEEIKVYGSGRTDAGVHALNQVAHFRVSPGRELHKLQASLNGLAGPAISVKHLVPVSPRFHARHSAIGKIYRYHLFNRRYPPVFARDRAWWIRSPLDLPAMRTAAAALLGEQDFSAFRAAECAAASPVRTMRRIELESGDWSDGTLRIEMDASGFLQHMARIIVGTLVAVGLGRLEPVGIPRILAGSRREAADSTAPGHGLYLLRVCYDSAEFPELRALESDPG